MSQLPRALQERLQIILYHDDVEAYKGILGEGAPLLEVNSIFKGMCNGITCTMLHASIREQKPELFTFLLNHPDVYLDVHEGRSGEHPLMVALTTWNLPAMKRLLGHQKVFVDLCNPLTEHTVLHHAALYRDDISYIRTILASGRDVDVFRKGPGIWPHCVDPLPSNHREECRCGQGPMTAREMAVFSRHSDTSALLEVVERDPFTELRRLFLIERPLMLGDIRFPATLFAVVVFVSDGYLRCVSGNRFTRRDTRSFFDVTERLPIELQMMICLRVYGHRKGSFVLSTQAEDAFKYLARVC